MMDVDLGSEDCNPELEGYVFGGVCCRCGLCRCGFVGAGGGIVAVALFIKIIFYTQREQII